MGLLLVFIVNVLIAQAIAIILGLVVEHYYSAYAGLVAFIALYFGGFVVAWRLAVHFTDPQTRLGAMLGKTAK